MTGKREVRGAPGRSKREDHQCYWPQPPNPSLAYLKAGASHQTQSPTRAAQAETQRLRSICAMRD
jgi:hypothetical protein